jgi:hypothetical protein
MLAELLSRARQRAVLAAHSSYALAVAVALGL